MSNPIESDIKLLHDKAPLIDLHADTFSSLESTSDFTSAWLKKHIDLQRMLKTGLWAEAFSLFVYPKWGREKPKRWHKIAIRELENIENAVQNSQGQFAIAHNSAEIIANKAKGVVSAVIEIEGLHSLLGELNEINNFFNRGVRIFTLTWNNSNDWATSCMAPTAKTEGLTEDGIEAVRKIDSLGGFIDFSHSGEQTFWQTMDIIERPPICTHSCCMALQTSPRNLTDEQISAIIDKNGIIGVNFYPAFLSPKDKSEVTSVDIVDHIEHIISLGGEGNVGLGSDFDGISHLPTDIDDCTGLANITRELIRRGFSEEKILKILGGNFLRVFE
ncbi:dipeptidase [bacterium]|nr:dipeptidase [bacterium]